MLNRIGLFAVGFFRMDALQWITVAFIALFTLSQVTFAQAQTPATSGTFVLHKFAKAIGEESYSIETKGEQYTLNSHFAFTDRGSAVPLETKFSARSADMSPLNYAAKGKSSRSPRHRRKSPLKEKPNRR